MALNSAFTTMHNVASFEPVLGMASGHLEAGAVGACGRYTLSTAGDELWQRFDIHGEQLLLVSRFNILAVGKMTTWPSSTLGPA